MCAHIGNAKATALEAPSSHKYRVEYFAVAIKKIKFKNSKRKSTTLHEETSITQRNQICDDRVYVNFFPF